MSNSVLTRFAMALFLAGFSGSALSGPVAIAPLGDSRTAIMAFDAAHLNKTTLSHLNWANALHQQKYHTTGNFGISGAVSDTILAGMLVPALATHPTHMTILMGVNDVRKPGYSAGHTMANITEAASRALAQGTVPILFTDPGSEHYQPAQVAFINDVNARIRTYCAVTPGAVLFDMEALVSTQRTPSIVLRPGWTYDGLHLSTLGAYEIGVAFAALMDSLGAETPAYPGLSGNVLANTAFSGTNGPVGAGNTGTLPDAFSGSRDNANCVSVYSVNTRPDQTRELAVALATSGSHSLAGMRITQTVPLSVVAPGDSLQAGVQVTVDAGSVNLADVRAEVDLVFQDGFAIAYDFNGTKTGGTISSIPGSPELFLTLQSPRVPVPAGKELTGIQFRLGARIMGPGHATLRFRNPWCKVIPGDALVPEPARASDSLVDTIGVATHWGFRDTVYARQGDALRRLLGELGVRTVRDSLDPRLDELWTSYGIKAIVVTEPSRPLEDYLDSWKQGRHRIAAIEGSNEVNGSWEKLGLRYQGKGWPEGPRLFHEDMVNCIRNDPDLAGIPVIAPSTAHKGAGRQLAPLRSPDFANAHSYAGGQMPSRSLDFRDSYLLLGRGAVLPPMVATESGYHTCLGSSKVIAGSQPGVSHSAHRKYIPRHVAEYFNAGFHWTVIYEFAAGRPGKTEQEDPEAAFGLLMPDGTPKPAYYALRDLIAILSESKWDRTAGHWNSPVPPAPRALAFALEDAPATVHHTLLQRSDGSFQLLLWNEVSSFNLQGRTDVDNPDVPVTLVLDREAAWITVSRLGPDAPPVQRFESLRRVRLDVPDEVIVVGVRLATPLAPVALPSPAGIEVKTTPTSAELAWASQPGVDAYWVTLNGRQLGRARRDPDGKVSFGIQSLIPATTVNVQVVATAGDGGVSAPVIVPVSTVDAFPDLVVSRLDIVPAAPAEGEPVTYVAMVENRGNAPVEPGIVLGVKFQVDGKTVCWSDNVRGPLAPGQCVNVRPSGGPDGAASMVLAPGLHQVTAIGDDVDRIVESDEENNRFTRAVTIAGPVAEPVRKPAP